MSSIMIPIVHGDYENKPIPDGRHNLLIKKVFWKAETQRLSLLYETENGESDFESYNFRSDKKGVMNDKAIRAFSYTAKCA